MIAVLDYGIGNLRSAEKAFQRVGADARLVQRPEEAAGAAGIVLPGVGAFGRCMAAIRAAGFDDVARDAVGRGTPFLGICIGLQVLYDGSEEDPEVAGLGLLPGKVRRLPEGVKHPQMQWNVLRPTTSDAVMLRGVDQPAWVYFVHSYAPEPTDAVVATCDYGGDVVASIEQGPLWGTQFHPEKSGSTGLAILANFVRACGERS